MTDEQMKKLLEEDTGEVPERFHQAILAAFGQIEDEPFDGTELPISVEAAEKPRRPRHVPRQGGRFRRMMLVMLITLGRWQRCCGLCVFARGCVSGAGVSCAADGGGQRGYGMGDSTPHAEVSSAAAFCAAAAGRFFCSLILRCRGNRRCGAENGGKFDVQAEKERTKKPSEQNSEGFGAADGT